MYSALYMVSKGSAQGKLRGSQGITAVKPATWGCSVPRSSGVARANSLHKIGVEGKRRAAIGNRLTNSNLVVGQNAL